MKEKLPQSCDTPSEWLKNNRKELAEYAGEWIAFNQNGVIAHNKSGKMAAQEARSKQTDYVFKYVRPFEIPRVVRILTFSI